MRRLIVIIFCCSIIAACNQNQQDQSSLQERKETLPYYTTADFTPHWYAYVNALTDTIHRIPAFSFIDQNSNAVTERTVADKIYVADFFFTSCAGICPKLTKNLRLVQEAFKDDSMVMLLSHSVTPGKDDPEALKKYAINYGVTNNKWFLLTGNRDSIYTIARKSYFAEENLGLKKDSNDFLHTENVLLIDKRRRIRGIYKGTSASEMQNIITDIKLLETESAE